MDDTQNFRGANKPKLLRRVLPALLQSTLPCVSSHSHLSSSLARSTVSLQTLIKSLSHELVFSAILEMKLARFALRSYDGSTKFGQLCKARAISTNTPSGDVTNGRNESPDEFEQRIFGGYSSNNPTADAFYQKLDRLEKARGRPAFNSKMDGNNTGGSNSSLLDGLDDSFSTLSDGMDGKLKNAANYFEFDPDEINSEDYAFRPDVTFTKGMTYEPKDLDLTKPGVRKPLKRYEFEVTTEEVLRKADFRNVRFLANFITEAGIIIKRSQTRISAKAQRKIAREIKTARAFGLMPFTTMGQDSFAYGKSRERQEEEEEEVAVEDNYDDPISPEDII